MAPTPTRDAVLDAALQLLAEDGPGGVTIARITGLSGVSNGSIYHHFGSREGVLLALLVDCFADLVATLAQALDDRPARECIRDLVARHLAWVREHPGKAAVLYRVPLDATVLSGTADSQRAVHTKTSPRPPSCAGCAPGKRPANCVPSRTGRSIRSFSRRSMRPPGAACSAPRRRSRSPRWSGPGSKPDRTLPRLSSPSGRGPPNTGRAA